MAHNALLTNLPGVQLLPDNRDYTNRFHIRSETSSRLYVVAQRKTGGPFSCSCMGWIRHRHCKHLKSMAPVLSVIERLPR